MKALLIVDMQNDFLPGGSLAVAGGDKIIQVINDLQVSYDLVVATQDWHPSNHISFAASHEGHKEFEQIVVGDREQVLWPVHCVQGSKGAELTDRLDVENIAAVFRKGMDPLVDSYSGFFDNDKSKATGLTGFLKGLSVTEIHVCGLAADFCVYYTAMDGLAEGFKSAIITGATKAIDEEQNAGKMNLFKSKGGLLL